MLPLLSMLRRQDAVAAGSNRRLGERPVISSDRDSAGFSGVAKGLSMIIIWRIAACPEGPTLTRFTSSGMSTAWATCMKIVDFGPWWFSSRHAGMHKIQRLCRLHAFVMHWQVRLWQQPVVCVCNLCTCHMRSFA